MESADGRVSLSAGDLTARLTVDGPWGLELHARRPDARERGPHGPGSMQVVDDPTHRGRRT